MYQAMIFSFKVSQNFIVYESAEDRNLWAIFNRVKKCIILQYFYQIILQKGCLTYLQRWICFLGQPFSPRALKMVWFKRCWTGDYMAWGSISLFGDFLENENSLETLIVIFETDSPKGSFWLKMKYFEISVLTANSRYLQTAALKHCRNLLASCFRNFGKQNITRNRCCG